MNGLSGQFNTKDTDREILLRLSDEDLINTCRLNKYLFNNVCDDNFFGRKLQLTYPDTLRYFDVKRYKNYKNFYLNTVFYIAKLKEDFKYYYVSRNPKTQYEIFKRVSQEVIKENKKEFLIDYSQLLRIAAITGELDLVKEAVNQGANIHAYDEYALRYASEKGRLEVVKYLVEKGANIHALDESALRWASDNGHLQVVKYLVENGADIHAKNDQALRWASENGHDKVVKYLRDQQAGH